MAAFARLPTNHYEKSFYSNRLVSKAKFCNAYKYITHKHMGTVERYVQCPKVEVEVRIWTLVVNA